MNSYLSERQFKTIFNREKAAFTSTPGHPVYFWPSPPFPVHSGPSSYDRPDIQTTWVTTKILVLTYDQSLELRPECRSSSKRVSACAVGNKDPRDAFVWAQIREFVDVISVSAVLYIINFANCYEIVVSGRLGTFYNFLVSTLGKLVLFLVNYAHYTTLFYYEKLR
jgi:hypothetical protein